MGSLYQPSGVEELSRRFLRDIELSAIQSGTNDVPVQYGSDFWLTSQAISGICLQGFRNIDLSEADQNVLDATGSALDKLRIGYGIPEVTPTKASGKIRLKVSGVTTVPNNQAFVYPNGTSGKIVGTYINPANLAEVNVECNIPGTVGNLKSGEIVRLIGPPVNVDSSATVSTSSPIKGGTDVEDDTRKRNRILNVLRNKPAGGNWSDIRRIVLDNVGGVQECFIYPALGGPSSVKIIAIKDFDLENYDFSRSIPDVNLNAVRSIIQSSFPGEVQIVVQTCITEYTDIGLRLTIPLSSQSGGNGLGWTDISPWPLLVTGDNGRITLSSPNATFDTFIVNAGTAIQPVDGQTHISWWSSKTRKFYTGLVVGHVGGAGSWSVTLDRPLIDDLGNGPTAGEFISPTCQNIDGYGESLVSTFRTMGPGENTSQSSRLPRALRHPFPSDIFPYSISNSSIKKLISKYSEITEFSFGHILKTMPTVPSNATIPTNILIPRNFGVYKL